MTIQEQAGAMILKNRKVIIRTVASTGDITESSARSVVHDVPVFHRVCAWWVLRKLTEEHKHSHVSISSCLLTWHCNEGESFFNCIISDLNTQLWTTKHCVQWKHCHLLAQKMQDSAIGWEFNGDVLVLSRSYPSTLPEMWNYSNKFIKCSGILWNDRRPVIPKKQQGRLSKRCSHLIWQCWTSFCCPYWGNPSGAQILKFLAIQHAVQTAYSDFRLYGPLNGTVRGHRFEDDDVKEAVHNWPCTQHKQFFFYKAS